MPDKKLIIIGAGGHAQSVANVARSAGYDILGFVDAAKANEIVFGCPVAETIDAFASGSPLHLAIGIGANNSRARVAQKMQKTYPHAVFPVLAHQSAVISSQVSVNKGTVLMPGAVIGPNSAIGAFCLLNTHSAIDHDGKMGDFSSLAPGAIAGGNVTLGERTAISLSAAVKHGIKLGADSVLGANSYLNTDLPPLTVAYGSPARIIRSRDANASYLG